MDARVGDKVTLDSPAHHDPLVAQAVPLGRPTPWPAYIFLALFDLLTLAVAWDIVVRFWRTLTGKQPVVEIDHDRLELGSVAQVRLTEPFTRTVPIRIPSDPPDPAADWTIAVNTTLRQGGIIAHEFPIKVRKPRPSA